MLNWLQNSRFLNKVLFILNIKYPCYTCTFEPNFVASKDAPSSILSLSSVDQGGSFFKKVINITFILRKRLKISPELHITSYKFKMTKLFIFAILILALLTLSEAKKVRFIFSFIFSLIILYFQKSKHQKEKQDEKQENVIADSEKTRQGKWFEIK